MEFTLTFTVPSKLLISAAIIASAASIWHLLCIFGGPSWFAFARAPQQIIESAQQGTLLAPIGTIVVAGLMFACSIFAFSAVGIIGKVALIKPALSSIGILCTLRGVMFIPTLINSVNLDVWQLVASSVWLYVGICFILGSLEQHKLSKRGN